LPPVPRLLATAFAAVLGATSALAPRTASPVAPAGSLFSEGIPMRSPTAVGMSAERLAAIDRVVLNGIHAGGFPGAAVVVGRDGYAVVKRGYGRLTWQADGPAATEHTIYDLASLTKVVATTSAIMVLVDEGKLDLDAPVRQYVPAFAGGAKDRVTVRHLLTHRSGLPAGRDLWRSAASPAEARRQVLESRLYCEPGACYEYSDLGADVLGFVAETVSGQRLDHFVATRVFAPLGMNDTFFRPAPELRARIAPTELAPPRGYPLRGEVHDENAYALGGVAGHAGLFSTAADLSIFAQTLLNGGVYRGVRVFSDSTVRQFTRRAAGTRALGWDTCAKNSACGEMMGESAFGHTGFTGTSLWLDPEQRMFVLLLTNRVYDARAARPARVISDVRADLADAAELAVLDDPRGVAEMPATFRADEGEGWNTVAVARERPRREASARGEARLARAAAARRAKGKAAKAVRAAAAKKARSAKGAKGAKVERSATRGADRASGRAAERAATKRGAKASGRTAAKGSAGSRKAASKAGRAKAPAKRARR
jgi:CubicO group peptidase (beta-lactamase class C family)